ncbi:MAG: hypothetical protein WA064_03115 [Candidatus Moraniibacteriota bacterium]
MLKRIVITTLIILLSFGIGLFLGVKLGSPRLASTDLSSVAPLSKTQSAQPDCTATDKQLTENIAVKSLIELQNKTVSGTIEKVSENTINLNNVAFLDSSSNSTVTTRTVRITADTKFFQLVQKDCAQVKAEMEDFKNKIATNESNLKQTLATPQLEEKKVATMTDLKEGQLLLITSADAIGDKQDFVANEITIYAN